MGGASLISNNQLVRKIFVGNILFWKTGEPWILELAIQALTKIIDYTNSIRWLLSLRWQRYCHHCHHCHYQTYVWILVKIMIQVTLATLVAGLQKDDGQCGDAPLTRWILWLLSSSWLSWWWWWWLWLTSSSLSPLFIIIIIIVIIIIIIPSELSVICGTVDILDATELPDVQERNVSRWS